MKDAPAIVHCREMRRTNPWGARPACTELCQKSSKLLFSDKEPASMWIQEFVREKAQYRMRKAVGKTFYDLGFDSAPILSCVGLARTSAAEFSTRTLQFYELLQ